MTRGRWIILGVVLAIAAAAWFAFGRDGDLGANYRVAEVTRGNLQEAISANGTINPVRVINVGTQVSGTVAKLNVDYNDRVVAGQVLLTLDPRVYQARLAASEAQLSNLRATAALQSANARRAAELRRQQFISQQDYESSVAGAASAAAQVRSAEAQIVQDRTNLGYTVIRSPVAGVVISRQVDIGQTVAASFQTPTLFTIAQDLSRMQIEAQIAEADVAKVRVGQRVAFTVDAYADRSFEGRVEQLRLNPQTVQNVVTYTAVVSVPNPDGALLPGMTANAEFLVRDFRGAVLVPNGALSWKPKDWRQQRGTPVRIGPGGGEAARLQQAREAAAEAAANARDPNRVTVFVLGADGQPQPRRIRVGASDAERSVVLEGRLAAGERVITGENDPAAAAGRREGGPPPNP